MSEKGKVIDLASMKGFPAREVPAKVIRELDIDPTRGSEHHPPNYGRTTIPHIMTFRGRSTTISRVYREHDEALRDSRVNAEYMRNDCGIMECLEARQRSTALLKWHLVPEDENDNHQLEVASELTKIIKRIPQFVEYRRQLLEALWYGRYGIQHQYGWVKINGKKRIGIEKTTPVNGDKLVFRYDEGNYEWDETQVGVRLGTGYSGARLDTRKVEPTDRGLAYFLDKNERDYIAIHKHIIEDGDYEDVLSAGSVHGTGIRSRIYWTWFQMVEMLSLLVEYLERSALGIELWKYPAGNPEAQKETETAAENRLSGGRSIILVPTPMGEDKDAYGVEHIEPGLAGVDAVKDVIVNYFFWRIKRYILGQILTSESDATGLGSGVADLHYATYLDIIRYDARKLSDTLTTELVPFLQSSNFPGDDFHIRFVIDTEAPEIEKKLQGWRQAFDMGMKIKEEDLASMMGASLPLKGERFLQSPLFQKAVQEVRTGDEEDIEEEAESDGQFPANIAGDISRIVAGTQDFGKERTIESCGGGPDPFTCVEDTHQLKLDFDKQNYSMEFIKEGLYVWIAGDKKYIVWKSPAGKENIWAAAESTEGEKGPEYSDLITSARTLQEVSDTLQNLGEQKN